jgi:hypothetical protein
MGFFITKIRKITGIGNSNEEWRRIVAKEQLFSEIRFSGRAGGGSPTLKPVNSRDLREFTGSFGSYQQDKSYWSKHRIYRT